MGGFLLGDGQVCDSLYETRNLVTAQRRILATTSRFLCGSEYRSPNLLQ